MKWPALGLEKMDAICLTCVFISCSQTKYVTHSPVSLSPGVYPFSCTLFMWCKQGSQTRASQMVPISPVAQVHTILCFAEIRVSDK